MHGQVLLREGITCICAGGGGIPVAQERSSDNRAGWRRHGVEAVIDKARLLGLLPCMAPPQPCCCLNDPVM